MSDHRTESLETFLMVLVEELADRLTPRLAQLATVESSMTSPWLTTAEAIDYTRLPEGTFRKLAACGTIPSHGGRAKLFYRPELDQTLLEFHGLQDEGRTLRQVR